MPAEQVFVDAVHYIAVLMEDDELHREALSVARSLSGIRFITAEPVIFEVLAHMSGLGPQARRQAAGFVDDLRNDPSTTIVPATRDLFDRSLALYRSRLDKAYSLADCAAIVICRDRGIVRVLTHDHHFEQEGLTILL